MRYIVFEGIDGSGKSTLSKMFADYLISKGYKVFHTKEPYTVEIEASIRRKQADQALLFLFLVDREIHIQELKKQHVDFIISDRSFYSTIAYQCYGAGMDINFVTHLNEMAIEGFVPDTVIYLDCSVEVALNRLKKLDAIESKDISFFKKVRNGYLKLAQQHKFLVINAELDLDKAFVKLIEII